MEYFDLIFITILVLLSDNMFTLTAGLILGYCVSRFLIKHNLFELIFTKSIKYISFLIFLLIFILFYISPFYLFTNVYSGSNLSWYDVHYALTILPGLDFLNYGYSERSNYGPGLTLISFIGFYLLNILDFTPFNFSLYLKFINLFNLLIIVLVFFINNKKNFLILSLLVVLLVPNLSNLSSGIDTPNQNSIRYTSFLIIFLIYSFINFHYKLNNFVLIILSAILVTLSPDLGLVFVSGIFFHIFSYNFKKYNYFGSFLFTFLYLLLFITLALILTFSISDLFYFSSISNPFFFLEKFSSFITGPINRPNILTGIIILICFISFSKFFYKLFHGTLNNIDLYQASVGMMMLVWIFYYLKMMIYSNLWFEVLLLLFFISPRFSLNSIFLIKQKKKFCSFYSTLIISLFFSLLLTSISTYNVYYYNFITAINSKCKTNKSSIVILDSICFVQNSKDGYYINSYFDFANKNIDKYNSILLSNFPYTVRVSGFNNKFPWYDHFGEAMLKNDIIEQVNWLDSQGPKYIYVDNPESRISRELSLRTIQTLKLMDSLSNYEVNLLFKNEFFILYERR
jgi:hypothetical protein